MKRPPGLRLANTGHGYLRESGHKNLSNYQKLTGHKSVWRPLVDIVQTDPLVYCDTWTVTDSDLDIVQKVMNDTVEESMYLKPRKEHQWYWMSNQTRDDVVIMTVWDSKRPLSRSGE